MSALSTDAGDFASIGQNGTDVGTLTVKGTGAVQRCRRLKRRRHRQQPRHIEHPGHATITVTTVGGFFVGSANAAGSTASGIVNQTGGTVTLSHTGDNSLVIGGRIAGATGSGTYNLSGGTLTNAGTAGSAASARELSITRPETGTIRGQLPLVAKREARARIILTAARLPHKRHRRQRHEHVQLQRGHAQCREQPSYMTGLTTAQVRMATSIDTNEIRYHCRAGVTA